MLFSQFFARLIAPSFLTLKLSEFWILHFPLERASLSLKVKNLCVCVCPPKIILLLTEIKMPYKLGYKIKHKLKATNCRPSENFLASAILEMKQPPHAALQCIDQKHLF